MDSTGTEDVPDLLVLVVDDEPDVVELTASMLESESARITTATATSASDGLDHLSSRDVDCVVSDFDMPETNGLEFLDAVREAHPALPFILFTGKGSEEIASEAIARGVSDYLQKDIGSDQYTLLANRVHNAVSQYRAERQAHLQTRINTVVNEVNQRLVRAEQSTGVYRALCSVLTETGNLEAAWAGPYDASTDRIEPVYATDREGRALDSPSTVDVSGTDSPVGAAIAANEVRITPDPPSWYGLRSTEADVAGATAGSLVVVPLGIADSVLGVVCGLVSSELGVDATERRMLAELGDDAGHALDALAVRRELRQYERIVETVPDGVFLLNSEGTIDFVNETAARMIGMDPGQLQGTPFPSLVESGLFEPAVMEEYVELVRGLLSSSTARERDTLEVHVELPDGTERIWEVHVSLRGGGEAFSGTVGVLHDATERFEREAELREAKTRYQHLVETSPAPIVIYDADGVVVFANEAAADLVGADSPSIIVGTSALEFIHPDDREDSRRQIRRVLQDREPVVGIERTLQGLDGDERYVVLATSPITYEGDPAGQVVLNDVTELQRERRRLDEFARRVSHDLRNPLTALSSRLELAESTGEQEHFERCRDAVERMDDLIDDLLALARKGKRIDEPRPTDLAAAARDSWMGPNRDDVTLAVETDRRVVADPDRLRDLLENLLGNAIEHAGPDVTVTVGTVEDGFYVADDGPGIPPERRNAVLRDGYSETEGGTGFGLSIVADIVDAHGWSLAVDESAAGGARFTVTGVEFAE